MAWKKACDRCGTEFTDNDDELRWNLVAGAGGVGTHNPKKIVARHWFCTACVVEGVKGAVGD